jgi:hypothetical protein
MVVAFQSNGNEVLIYNNLEGSPIFNYQIDFRVVKNIQVIKNYCIYLFQEETNLRF